MERVTPESSVNLQRITAASLEAVLALTVSEAQRAFVASNERSIAQAHFDEGAWFRAVYADDTPVGFVMLHDETLREKPREEGYCFLWRLMIDQRYQRMGFGRRAVRLVLAHARSRPGVEKLHTSYRCGEGSAEPFYEKLGFHATGEDESGEVHAHLDFG